ncbi:MAG: DMT family transporter [Ruminococcaceae bacterium]|nr:DMT family transporter [Oscillospiraceae bacterium]
MLGFIFAALAGAAMSVQGVFNTRLSEKIGLFESNTIVQGSAFLIALIVMLIFGKGDITKVGEVNKLYLFGGIIGFVITLTVMLAIKNLSPTVAISVILIAQLLVAAIIDAFGLFGSEKVPFTLTKYIGIGLMIAGVIIFKYKS